ncbi:MAG: hypothetical protein SOZ80_08750 [Prevotella sp.]|uniref:hypothetical protein n=1 Tax=Prevotella sp. TaxID=59823 RepID=UPI002A7EA673|nr:hypothetical protein [Prevotella sp.]MDY4020844.1 hypothetical protein [Prevotella sp.]
MKKKQVTKKAYLAPCVEICPVRIENSMLANSPVNGGHHDAGDDGELNAKQFHFDDEDVFGQNSRNPWED